MSGGNALFEDKDARTLNYRGPFPIPGQIGTSDKTLNHIRDRQCTLPVWTKHDDSTMTPRRIRLQIQKICIQSKPIRFRSEAS